MNIFPNVLPRRILLALALITACITASASKQNPSSKVFENDGITVKVGGKQGYSITVDGIPFSHISTLSLVDPAWQERYYGYGDDPQRVVDAKVTTIPDGIRRIVMPLQSSRYDVMQGTQTLDLLPGRQLRIAVDIRMTSTTPAVLENRIASITEAWISNRSITAQMADGATTRSRAPRWAPSDTPAQSTLVSNFRQLTIDSPRGPLDITVSGSANIALLDYRRNHWAQGERFYWLGILGSPVPQNDVLSYAVTFKFPEPQSSQPANTLTTPVDIISSQPLFKSPPAVDRIIPTPKQLTWGDGAMPVPRDMSVHVNTSTSLPAESERTLLESARQVIAQFGAPQSDSTSNTKHAGRLFSPYGTTLKLTDAADADIIVMLGESLGVADAEAAAEAYRINIVADKTTIQAETPAGLANALSTLHQLLRLDPATGVAIRRCSIFDYPSMPFRGIHFFTGKDSRDLQIKMVEKILAPLKINRLVYQVDYMKWDTLPQIHSAEYGMDKSDAKAVADTAQRLGINVIPLINTFGHSEWLLQKPEMRYLADDPEDPYAYDPSNPEVYEICESIYKEAIKLFQPDIIHIGHDEINLDGFPQKPANKAIGATQLLINDTVHYYTFLKNLGIRTMIWGDMFLGPGEAPDATLAPSKPEAARRRSLLPKDIMIADWHYRSAPVDEYESVEIFNDAGFEAIACTWNAPDNIVRFAKAASQQRDKTTRSLGLLQTTWAGYSFDQQSLVNSLDQYAAYVLAAEAAWTGGATGFSDVNFDHNQAFMRRWNSGTAAGTDTFGWHANLDPVANTVIIPERLNLADTALDALVPGIIDMSGYKFRVPGNAGKITALQLAGAWSDADEVQRRATLQLNSHDTASELYFALATPAAAPDSTPVGSIILTLENGETSTVSLVYGTNIMSIADSRQTLTAPVVWRSDNIPADQGAAAFHLLHWSNPHPRQPVKSVEFEASRTGPGIMLFGLSGSTSLHRPD